MVKKLINPFRVEELRQKLAIVGDLTEFKNTYSGQYSEVEDLNKKQFWDKRIVEDRSLLENYPMYQDKVQIISQYLKNKKGDLLDIGFGWGVLEKKIEDLKNIKISGIDISKEAVNYATQNFKGEFKVADIFNLPFKINSFDIVTTLDVFEHILPSKVFSAYGEICKVLKKGGIFIVTIPINEGLEEMIKKGLNPIGHVRAYTDEIIEAELKLAGFEILETKFLYAFRSNYKIKSIVEKFDFINFRKPNLMIIFSSKI